MGTEELCTADPAGAALAVSEQQPVPPPAAAVTLLTGGIDRPYAYGLTLALASGNVSVDLIGASELDGPVIRSLPTVTFFNLHGDMRRKTGPAKKALHHLGFYLRLLRYSLAAKPRIFHILWNYRFQLFDRTLLMLFYRMLGKKIVLTAHNVNAAARDGKETMANRLTLRLQYRLCDHIFVHTDAMKSDLVDHFGVRPQSVTAIPFGVNNSVPDTDLTPAGARARLGLGASEKTILFFGRIREYKGLHCLVEAFRTLAASDPDYRLIIAGEPKKESAEYWQEVSARMDAMPCQHQVIREARFIRDEETEIFFKAADVVVLPYTSIFQSGVLFLAYSFGVPVIASDVGSLRDDIVEGETGYVCRPGDVADLAATLRLYFQSDLFANLSRRRADIRAFVAGRNSWDQVEKTTVQVYTDLLTAN